MLGVVLPIRRQVKNTAHPQLVPDALHKLVLDQATLVMLLLVPGIGEEHHHPIQTGVRQAQVDDVVGVDAIDPDILQTAIFHFLEQGANTRQVHFDTNEILFRRGLGHIRQRPAHAKTDLQVQHGFAAEHFPWVNHAVFAGQAVLRPAAFIGFLLALGHPALPKHEAANATAGGYRRLGSCFLRLMRVFLVGHLKSSTAGCGSD